MYTLDWLGVFKEGFSWIYDKGKFTLSLFKELKNQILYLTPVLFIVFVISLIIQLGAVFLLPNQAVVYLILVAAVNILSYLAIAISSAYLLMLLFSYAFKASKMKFEKNIGIIPALKYVLFWVTKSIFIWLAIPSRLKFIAIPIAILLLVAYGFLIYTMSQVLIRAFNPSTYVSAQGFAGLQSSMMIGLLWIILIPLIIISNVIWAYMRARLETVDVEYFSGKGIIQSLDDAYNS